MLQPIRKGLVPYIRVRSLLIQTWSPCSLPAISCRNVGEMADQLSSRPQHIRFEKYHKPKNQMEKLLLLEEDDDDVIKMFLTKTIDRKPSTEVKPNLVPSIEANRLIACQCDLEGLDVRFTLLHKDQVQKCDCGHWFKLVDAISPFTKDKGSTFK